MPLPLGGSDKNLSLVLCLYFICDIFYGSSCTVSVSFYEGSRKIFQSPPVVQNQKIFAEFLNCNFLEIDLIQGDSGGTCTTLGNDSMSDSKQRSSYEHGSDCERLWSYDCLKLGTEGNDY